MIVEPVSQDRLDQQVIGGLRHSHAHPEIAGEYCFSGASTPFEVYGRIARGDIFFYELVVPEGKNMFDIGAAAEQLHLFSEEQFLKAARDPALIRDLDPEAPTLEGYLFPHTYRLGRHGWRRSPRAICGS